jgi:hypothetical protein
LAFALAPLLFARGIAAFLELPGLVATSDGGVDESCGNVYAAIYDAAKLRATYNRRTAHQEPSNPRRPGPPFRGVPFSGEEDFELSSLGNRASAPGRKKPPAKNSPLNFETKSLYIGIPLNL